MSMAAIRPMADPDMDAVCRVIGLAFADNPSTLANVGGDRAKARRTIEGAARVVKFGSKWSHALVAERDGRIVGVLNAAPWPHCQASASEKLTWAPSMMRAMGSALPRAFRMMSARAKHDPGERHWHLGPIGVHPDYQHAGIGTALLTAFLSVVDANNTPAFLETDVEANVALYQTFGFVVVSEQDIIGINTRFMWRAARETTDLKGD